MGQSKWALACLLLACITSNGAFAQEPAAGDPFGESAPAASTTAPADDDIFSESAAGAAATPAPRASDQSASSSDMERRAEQRIAQVLDQQLRSPLEFFDTPLNSVVGVISEEYDIPILFDSRALEAAAVSPEYEISIQIRNVSLRNAIELTLRQVENLTYIFDREVLLITTEEEAAQHILTRVYRIDDLLPVGDDQPTDAVKASTAPFTSIVDVITRCVDRDSWALNGSGEGEICVIEPGVMVITQTHAVHEQVERLLATVRRVKAAIEGNAVVASTGRPFE
jgi:hypothetical protein